MNTNTADSLRITSHDEAVEAAGRLAEQLAVEAISRDRTGGVSESASSLLDLSGLLSLTIPRELGGADLSSVTIAAVVATVAAADPSTAQLLQPHYSMLDALRAAGTLEQQEYIFAEVSKGARIGGAVAERGGQHGHAFAARLSTGPAGLTLDGTKYYCTGAATAGLLAVVAHDERERRALAFVPTSACGIEILDDWAGFGQRGTMSGTTVFTGVGADPDLVLDYESIFARPQAVGARAQLIHAAIEVGIARGALTDARDFVRTSARPSFEAVRSGWAKSAAEDPYTVVRIGKLSSHVAAAEHLLAAAAAEVAHTPLLVDTESVAAHTSVMVAQAKSFACEVAVSVASELFALSGAGATDGRHALDRHWRNASTHSAHDSIDWKHHHIGAYLLSGTVPPNHGQI